LPHHIFPEDLIWLNRTISQMTIHFLDMMHFQRNTVFTALHGSPQLNASLHLKTIQETENESFNANSDNTTLVAILLSIKCWEMTILEWIPVLVDTVPLIIWLGYIV
jgi:hypothetical protein